MLSSGSSTKRIYIHHMKVGLYKALWNVGVCYEYDQEANVWTATSEDIPGLWLEDEDLDRLKERVKEAIPELL